MDLSGQLSQCSYQTKFENHAELITLIILTFQNFKNKSCVKFPKNLKALKQTLNKTKY